jgi:nucleoside-diphosphate-sugar epimerase
MAINRKKILVTGASGLIGREICKQLSNLHTVIAVDNNWKYKEYHPVCSSFINLSTQDFVKSTVNDFDIIYHMGAINGTGFFYSIPNTVLENNITGDLAIFNFAKTNPDCKLIYASSSEVVADADVPTDEITDITINNIHNPRWSYRLAKILAENYLVNSNINYLIIRFFNVYSECASTGHMIKEQLDKFALGNFEIINPTNTRCFCYVEDAVSALITVAELANKEVINIGSDDEITVELAVKLLAAAQGIKVDCWTEIISHAGSTLRRQPSLTKLRKYIPSYYPRKFSQIVEKLKLSNSIDTA